MGTLALTALDVGIGGKALLRGVGLRVEPAERVAVAGPSGCGKTTLLRTVAGLIDPLGGGITLDERAPHEIGWPRWRRRVCYVAQRPVLLPGTVGDNLRRPFDYRTAGARVPDGALAEQLSRLGLEAGIEDAQADRLSEGQKQRVALVRALAVEPDVLLLDEPTSALDPASTEAAEQLVREAGCAALIVTHDVAQASRWCDRSLDLLPLCPPEEGS